MRHNHGVANPDRLTGLDASFLHFEEGGAHMHVGSVLLFEGDAPPYEEFVAQLERRLALVPRYRQKLAYPPLVQSRPVWVDDPHFNAGYHVRHTALPAPAGEEELRRLAGRVFAQRLDRAKPLWELWLVDRVGDGRFALIAKTHHCLVDGISGVDITTVLFDLEPEPPAQQPPEPWVPRPVPSSATLLADALGERAVTPLELARAAAGALTRPDRALRAGATAAVGLAAITRAGVDGAPRSPLNGRIGPHRRFAWVDAELASLKAVKNALGGTVNDVVLAAVAGALRTYHLAHAWPTTEGLRAMVPVSVRADAERGALGNKVSTIYAPLPIDLDDPIARFRAVHEAMRGLKESGQAVGAEMLTQLADFAPPTILAQAARLQAVQRFFNLTVTNVPGPQFPLYLLGRRLCRVYPQVPLAENCALGVAIMSYDGQIDFGLIADYDTIPDLDAIAAALAQELGELASAAGAPPPSANSRSRTKSIASA
ncbi:MAG TPA: wax ester/triacylglycerol synthase family O-acyltransferase [Solirubrobacteraceae bacterium]|nr:wax ester/triacylglycerol synthase family O-acyltransferase [Solirubrobacteraceae bacterium]